MDVSLTKLRQLVTVAQEKSVSKAANVLGISQPALSRSIVSIEARYGVRIFERGRRGAELTAAGAAIVDHVLALLRSVDNLDQNLMLYGKGHLGTLAFGISPQLGSVIGKTIVVDLFRECPDITLNLVVRSAPELYDALLSNEIEFFVCIDSQLKHDPIIDVELICQSGTALCVGASHPLAAATNVTQSEVRQYPFASPIPSDRRGGKPKPSFVCNNFHIIRDVVESSDMVCACTPALLKEHIERGYLVVLPVADNLLHPRSIFMSRLRGRNPSPLAHRVMAMARTTLKNELNALI